MASNPGEIRRRETVPAIEHERLQNAYDDLKRKYDALVDEAGRYGMLPELKMQSRDLYDGYREQVPFQRAFFEKAST
jgi:hypothetical protein